MQFMTIWQFSLVLAAILASAQSPDEGSTLPAGGHRKIELKTDVSSPTEFLKPMDAVVYVSEVSFEGAQEKHVMAELIVSYWGIRPIVQVAQGRTAVPTEGESWNSDKNEREKMGNGQHMTPVSFVVKPDEPDLEILIINPSDEEGTHVSVKLIIRAPRRTLVSFILGAVALTTGFYSLLLATSCAVKEHNRRSAAARRALQPPRRRRPSRDQKKVKHGVLDLETKFPTCSVQEALEMGTIHLGMVRADTTTVTLGQTPCMQEHRVVSSVSGMFVCSICLCDFAPEDYVRVLDCNHFFHTPCIDMWFKKHTLCPLCKQDYGAEAGDGEAAVEPAAVPASPLAPTPLAEGTLGLGGRLLEEDDWEPGMRFQPLHIASINIHQLDGGLNPIGCV